MVIPARLNKKEGIPPVTIPATLLNTKVKITEVNKGCMKYQRGLKLSVCIR